MSQYVVTGQPPDKGGRFAVGPLRSEKDGLQAGRLLVGVGWSEVWLLPLDESALAQLVAAGIRGGSDG